MTIRWLLCLIVLSLTGCASSQDGALARLSAVRTLFEPDRIVSNFSAMRMLFETVDLKTSGPPRPLPEGKALVFAAEFDQWRAARSVTGLVVLKDGAVVFEDYTLGTASTDRRISWSVAKSYVSVLTGIVVAEGHIKSVDDLAPDYAPELLGTPYEGVSIKDLLQMSSGVVFDENYQNAFSDINKMGRVLALGGSMDAFALKQRPRSGAPGTRWAYVSIDTHVLGLVLRRATGESLPELMRAHLLDPLGTYGDPYYITDSHGVAFALGGLNLTTRDYARFGEMVRRNGLFQGRRIAPADWIAKSTAPSARTEGGAYQYGYQWWMPPDAQQGEVFAYGVYGQFVYINRSKGVVIAMNAADRAFSNPGVLDDTIAGFRAIAKKAQAQ